MKLRNKKTGELGELQTSLKHIGVVVGNGTPETAISIYNSLAELNEVWEDAEDIYAPSIPLIKEEEIRKIIRAWADVNDVGELKYSYDENSLDDIYRNTISFNRWLGLEDGHSYTIPELCGEEEEC